MSARPPGDEWRKKILGGESDEPMKASGLKRSAGSAHRSPPRRPRQL